MWGVFSSNGDVIIPIKYEAIESLDVKNYFNIKTCGKWGVVDANNTIILNTIFDSSIKFDNNLFIVVLSQKFGLFNLRGEAICECVYTSFKKFSDNIFVMSHKSDFSLFDVIFTENSSIINNCINCTCIFSNIIVTNTSNKKFFVNKSGQVINGMLYDSVMKDNKYIIVESNGRKGILNSELTSILDVTYDNIERQDILYILSIDGKKGIFEFVNNIYVPCIYDNIVVVKESSYYTDKIKYYIVYQGALCGIVLHDGSQTIPCAYVSISVINNNYFLVTNNDGRVGLISMSGEVLVDCKYNSIELFTEEKYKVSLFKTDDLIGPKTIVYGLIDEKGNSITPVKYQDINTSRSGEIMLSTDGRRYYSLERELKYLKESVEYKKYSPLAIGTKFRGKVENVTKYGVFVRLGSHVGLLHISNIPKEKRKSLESFYFKGKLIVVAIDKVENDNKRISLKLV